VSQPTLSIDEITVHERDVRLRLPFRFGVITLTEAPQAFVRVRVRLADGRGAVGLAAEVLAPKWFDKAPSLSNEQSIEQLRRAIALAAEAYVAAPAATAFGLHAGCYADQLAAGAAAGLPPLAAGFGLALLDKAVIDGLCKAAGIGFAAAVRGNLIGLDDRLTPDLAGFDLPRFLACLVPRDSLAARHTVGMVDPLTAGDLADGAGPADPLPVTLEDVISRYANRHFKLKVGGDVDVDAARLAAIADVLDREAGSYAVSIDGNEQYADAGGVAALLDRLDAMPGLARFRSSILYLEQPIGRAASLGTDMAAIARRHPVIIDESDGTLDAFPAHRPLGYTGVSAKSCKGLYKALLNRARTVAWNAEVGEERYFLSAEDLTCQAGLGVQQDLALVSLLGIAHGERNGHYYGFGMSGAPAAEQAAFRNAHPELYDDVDGVSCLRIAGGVVDTRGLHAAPGLGGAVEPDVGAMRTAACFARAGG
jgi:hypothetical protein